MIDIHCHILPEVDDGADDMEDALEMAHLAYESGVRAIIATPHSCVPAFSPNFKSVGLLNRFRRLGEEIAAAGIPLKLYSGAEILCTRELPELLESGRLLTLANTRYLLVEFYFNSDPDFISSMLKLIKSNGYIPVVAHPERYETVQERPFLVDEWHDRGYVIQVNKGSITGRLGYHAQQTARWILSNGLAHVVASDAHGAYRRTPMMDRLYRHLEDELADGYSELLLKINPKQIICDKPVFSAGDRLKTDFFEDF